MKQPVIAYGAGTMETLEKDFEKSQFNIRKLLEEIAITAATEGMPGNDTKVAAAK